MPVQNTPKRNVKRKVDQEGTLTLKSIADNLTYIATFTYASYTFHASNDLQLHSEEPVISLSVLVNTQNILVTAKKIDTQKHNYIALY